MIDSNELYKPAMNFKDVKMSSRQKEAHDMMFEIADLFFSASQIPGFKVNGILLHGKPQSGKTETVKQLCRSIAVKYPKTLVAFLDSAIILHTELGVSEKLIESIFNPSRLSASRKIIFFDDIDCLFFGRENMTSQTWHISMSSVMFHCLDNIDPRSTFFIATSNKKELLDFAMQSRLMQVELKMPTKEELENDIKKLVNGFNKITKEQKENVIVKVQHDIVENETGFRDIQYNIVKYIAGLKKNA